jgi:AraC-like DNA-binding protein
MRQDPLIKQFDPKAGVAIASLAYDYPRGHQVVNHAHGSDQLIYAVSGVMEITVGQKVWLIPPQFAIWIPARVVHRIAMLSAVSMRTLYVRRGFAASMAHDCAVLHVTPLLRELILETVRIGNLLRRNAHHQALSELVVWNVTRATPIPIFLTMPHDKRALAVANAVIANLGNAPAFQALCSRAGTSVRTMERLFQRDVGTDFEAWRRQVRLVKAIEMLVAGHSVKEIAFAVGYRRASAFVAMFRSVFATTPKAWITAQVASLAK